MNVRPGTVADAAEAARLHAGQITEGFLPTLGQGFLTRLYERIARHDRSFLVVADDDGTVVGMAAGSEDVGALYKAFLVRDGVMAGLSAAPRIVRSWRKVLETLRYGSDEADDLPPAELLAVAVSPAARGRGVGRALVAAFQDELRRRDVPAARVVVGADNAVAIGLYEASGFRPAAKLEVHEGTPSQVLVWP